MFRFVQRRLIKDPFLATMGEFENVGENASNVIRPHYAERIGNRNNHRSF